MWLPDRRMILEKTNDHHVDATTSLFDRVLRTLKHGDLFETFARSGDAGDRVGHRENNLLDDGEAGPDVLALLAASPKSRPELG